MYIVVDRPVARVDDDGTLVREQRISSFDQVSVFTAAFVSRFFRVVVAFVRVRRFIYSFRTREKIHAGRGCNTVNPGDRR